MTLIQPPLITNDSLTDKYESGSEESGISERMGDQLDTISRHDLADLELTRGAGGPRGKEMSCRTMCPVATCETQNCGASIFTSYRETQLVVQTLRWRDRQWRFACRRSEPRGSLQSSDCHSHARQLIL